MSRSFKKNSFLNDLFPMPRKIAKKNHTRKIRKGKELDYCDDKITAFRDFMNINNFMGNKYKLYMK